eukprot:CAMPEP_0194544996 /NCGR_PEP_ID=MMETSP0253-20130528/88466_1 /TAXON_ID=2966 /ORGANISM="Noctiluca scintillans" /LENGTH=36 /DNA_ID= /DNA_START= /DNA_END= /DNA_ORIENTATION=
MTSSSGSFAMKKFGQPAWFSVWTKCTSSGFKGDNPT